MISLGESFGKCHWAPLGGGGLILAPGHPQTCFNYFHGPIGLGGNCIGQFSFIVTSPH